MKLRLTISEAHDVVLSNSEDSDFLSNADIASESDDDVAPVVVLD